jgi:hypothetical protein
MSPEPDINHGKSRCARESRYFVAKAKALVSDVMYVWQEIVLDSDEISATGGRPIENKGK